MVAITKDFADFTPATFPTLPHDGYHVSANEHVSLRIDALRSSTPADEALVVAWGMVLARYTDTYHVLFAVASSSQDTVQPCPLKLQTEEPIAAALLQAKQILGGLFEERLRGVNEPMNLLVIRNEIATLKTDFAYPLTIHCQIQQDAFQVEAHFDSRLLEPEMVQMMLFELRHTFQNMISTPQVLLHDLPACSPEGLQQILQWNAQTVHERSETLVHQLIEKQSQAQPSAQAVYAWDGTFTYEQLNAQASRLAVRLIAAGIGPNRFVGLLMEKSKWTAVAMLAVIKSGGCFFLLDASQPKQHLALMCRKTQPQVLLAAATHGGLADALEIPTLVLSADIPDIHVPSAELQTETIQPHHLLYAGFTSGSTGEPKAVVVDHTAFSSGLKAYCEGSGLTADSRVLQHASYSFVVSIIDQIAPLTQGSCICVPSEEQLQNDLAGAIRNVNADWAKLTPSALRLLAPSQVPGLKRLIIVGESLDAVELATWQRSGVSLSSVYGLSENCKGTMFGHRSDAGYEVGHFARPFNATPWVVDRHDPNILLPVGAEGELLLEGPCVGLGYIDNDEENEMTFNQNPAWLKGIRSKGQSRFLRTGDLVRYNVRGGTIHLLGRKGTRVKVRGQRIELAEIEHHLRLQFRTKEPVIVEVVVPSDDTAENPMLVAFVSFRDHISGPGNGFFMVPEGGFRDKARDALSNLRDILPSFMIPSTVVATLALPRTASGKLDRRIIREEACKLSRRELLAYICSETVHRNPTTDAEIILQQICAEVLDLPLSAVGMQASFFDLGGNSITARKLVTKARECGLKVTYSDMFVQPSLSTLGRCHWENTNGAAMEDSASDPFESLRNDFLASLPAPWTAEQIEDVLPALEEQSIMASWNEMDYHIFELTGPVDGFQLHRACQALVDRHAILRSIFIPFKESFLQVNLRHISVPFTIHGLTDQGAAENWANSLCQTDQLKLYQVDEPRLEFKLIQDAPEHFALIMRLPHAHYDATCLPKIVADLAAAYENRKILVESDFSSYVRHCFRQRTPEAYGFWRGLLQDSHITPAPLADIPVPEKECVTFDRLMPTVTPPKGFTMGTVIKAAWARLLEEQTGQSDLVFGQYIDGRNVPLPGIDDMVGPCVNIVPVRVQLATGRRTVHDLLQIIQAQHADSVRYESIGWKDITNTCTNWVRDSDPGSVVLFQNFAPMPELQMGQLRIRKLAYMSKIPALKTVYLIVYPRSTGVLLQLEASTALLRKDEGDRVMKRLSEMIQEMCADPTSPLS